MAAAAMAGPFVLEVHMHTRRFGPTGPRVSEVGLGTWQLGGAEWGDVSESQALAVLSAAADAGAYLVELTRFFHQ